jgi:hypothetical protein
VRHLQLHKVLAQGRSVGFLKAMFPCSAYLCCRLHHFLYLRWCMRSPAPAPQLASEALTVNHVKRGNYGRNKPVQDPFFRCARLQILSLPPPAILPFLLLVTYCSTGGV